MLYERSLEIENRLQAILDLIATGRYSTPELAEEIGVSVPTISRAVMALRQRGHAIRAERMGTVWHYVLEEVANENQLHGRYRGRKPR
ncbi:HTH domain-containing protein [Botrimarina hoheduenensis]|uniref:HTH domain protein n=1 Tax=Botrimarina hoheduenensis TaxID=2528000 RepID=A0A5C5VRV5_9BACT|nr:HTH domain-containing protein [Botrimarina hoheduenensis]TWT41366.1 HTH domain protein [Botrimarina hoheduenensis]